MRYQLPIGEPRRRSLWRRWSAAVITTLAVFLAAAPAWAWHGQGHEIITLAAVRVLAQADHDVDPVPTFFLQSAPALAHLCVDPDVLKHKDLPQLTDYEEPQHFLDYELVQKLDLPDKRSAYIDLLEKNKISPQKAGYLPYSISEAQQRLVMAFAEHRRWPDDQVIWAKALVYAGWLAHYAGDLEMPLHTSLDYDGRADPATGRSPHTGIHTKVDGLIEWLDLPPADLAQDQKPADLGPVFPAVMQELLTSHSHVEQVYGLESKLPASKQVDPATADPAVRAFSMERGRAAARFLASLYLTAWRQSAHIELPTWQVEARERHLQP